MPRSSFWRRYLVKVQTAVGYGCNALVLVSPIADTIMVPPYSILNRDGVAVALLAATRYLLPPVATAATRTQGSSCAGWHFPVIYNRHTQTKKIVAGGEKLVRKAIYPKCVIYCWRYRSILETVKRAV